MAEAAKGRRGSRKTNKPINLEENAKRRQWAGKQEAKEKEDRLRLAKKLHFWREGDRPEVGDFLLAYYPYKRKADSGFFIGKIAYINRENFDTQYFIRFLYTGATIKTPYHWLQPIYTYMKSQRRDKNCGKKLLQDEDGNFYDLEKSCVVQFLNKASQPAIEYKKKYKGKEPKKRKREVQEQKAPPLLAPPKRTAMAAAGPSSATQKREKPGPKGDWMRLYKQETENDSKQEMEDDSETDDEPEPNEKELPEESVTEFQKLLF